MDIRCNIEVPQQKYRLGADSNRLLGELGCGGGVGKRVFLDLISQVHIKRRLWPWFEGILFTVRGLKLTLN